MEYLTEAELSEILKVSRSTLWEMRKTGLPYRRIGGQIRYRINQVENWLDENCAGNAVKTATTEKEQSNNEYV